MISRSKIDAHSRRGAAAVLIVLSCVAVCCGAERVILDTDLGQDCDDAGAIAILHALADRGEVEILAIGVVNGNEYSVPLCDAINTFYGRPDVPIGVIKKGAPIDQNFFDLDDISSQHPHNLTKESAPEVVGLYRSVLAAQPDSSVVLVAIGQATNIANLLGSGPDKHSPLNGHELVARKVKLYAAGGNGRNRLPDGEAGWNYTNDLESAEYEMKHIPNDFPTVFAGGGGLQVISGQGYAQKSPDHIVRQCYRAYHDRKGEHQVWGRQSWDQLRLLFAVRSSFRKFFTLSRKGSITVDVGAKSIVWKNEPSRNHFYAVPSDPIKIRREVEHLMMHAQRP